MKVVILAGGLGTRLSEYTKTIPKLIIRLDLFSKFTDSNLPGSFHNCLFFAGHTYYTDFCVANLQLVSLKKSETKHSSNGFLYNFYSSYAN